MLSAFPVSLISEMPLAVLISLFVLLSPLTSYFHMLLGFLAILIYTILDLCVCGKYFWICSFVPENSFCFSDMFTISPACSAIALILSNRSFRNLQFLFIRCMSFANVRLFTSVLPTLIPQLLLPSPFLVLGM